MGPDRKTAAIIATSIAIGVAVDVVLLAFVLPLLVPPLFVRSGTSVADGSQITFRVSGSSGRLVGTWYAPEGGFISIYAAGTPSGLYAMPCIAGYPWHGSFNVTLAGGIYTMYFSMMGANLVVTSALTVLYPGNATPISTVWAASWCGLFAPAGAA